MGRRVGECRGDSPAPGGKEIVNNQSSIINERARIRSCRCKQRSKPALDPIGGGTLTCHGSRITNHGFQTTEDAEDAEECIYLRFTLHERPFTDVKPQMDPARPPAGTQYSLAKNAKKASMKRPFNLGDLCVFARDTFTVRKGLSTVVATVWNLIPVVPITQCRIRVHRR